MVFMEMVVLFHCSFVRRDGVGGKGFNCSKGVTLLGIFSQSPKCEPMVKNQFFYRLLCGVLPSVALGWTIVPRGSGIGHDTAQLLPQQG